MKIWGKDNSKKVYAYRKKESQKRKEMLYRTPVELMQNLVITKLECPKCGAKLYQSAAAPDGGPWYFCKKCDYRGLIGLEPEKQGRQK
jgi:predicted RNA-binding Zn-ribbon protein involved in translation (DUF1610 family)